MLAPTASATGAAAVDDLLAADEIAADAEELALAAPRSSARPERTREHRAGPPAAQQRVGRDAIVAERPAHDQLLPGNGRGSRPATGPSRTSLPRTRPCCIRPRDRSRPPRPAAPRAPRCGRGRARRRSTARLRRTGPRAAAPAAVHPRRCPHRHCTARGAAARLPLSARAARSSGPSSTTSHPSARRRPRGGGPSPRPAARGRPGAAQKALHGSAPPGSAGEHQHAVVLRSARSSSAVACSSRRLVEERDRAELRERRRSVRRAASHRPPRPRRPRSSPGSGSPGRPEPAAHAQLAAQLAHQCEGEPGLVRQQLREVRAGHPQQLAVAPRPHGCRARVPASAARAHRRPHPA